jgi:uncharacterized protein YqeY
MSIKNQLQTMLKEAVTSGDGPTKNVVRCLRAKVEQELLAAGLPRDLDDDKVFLKVIAAYRKSMMKAVEMLDRGGKGDSDLAASYRFEIGFCEQLLPAVKDADETRDIVRTKIAELGASGAKDTGRIIKAVMSDYPGEVDPALVSRMAKDLL